MNDWQAAAQQALVALWGIEVTCEITDTLRGEGRNRVYRLEVKQAPVSNVILTAAFRKNSA